MGARTELRRGEVIAALSLATDMAMGQPVEFALKSCVLGTRIGRALGCDTATLGEIFYQSLLRYIGCNGETHIMAALFGDEIDFRRDFAKIDIGRADEMVGLVFSYLRRANAGSGLDVSWRGHNDTALLASAYRAAPEGAQSALRALVEAMVAAFQRGDIPSIVAQFTPDCPLCETQARELPYAGTIIGAGKFFDLLLGAIEPSKFATDRYIADGENVMALGRWGGTSRATGKSFESDLALCFRIAGGKVTEFRGYDDTAVTAAALRP